MDVANLSDQQVYTLAGIAAYLTVLVLTVGTLAIVGTVRRLDAAKRPTPPTAEPPRGPARQPADEVPVAA